MVAGILYHTTFGVGQKDLQPYIQANRGMRTRYLLRMYSPLRVLRRRLTDDQRVPVPIGPQHEMHRDRCAHERAVHLDLERLTQLGWDMQMLPIRIQPDVAARLVLA